MIKLKRMRWAGHLTCMGEKTSACKVLVRKPEGRRLELYIDGRVVLKWILKK
jgi:hypothetical protein